MSVLQLVVKRTDPQSKEIMKNYGFTYYIRQLYVQTFGENAEITVPFEEFTVYALSTVFLNVVTMNLLISIISETYDRVTMTQKATDNK